jgi:hypothetical protein
MTGFRAVVDAPIVLGGGPGPSPVAVASPKRLVGTAFRALAARNSERMGKIYACTQ